MRNHLPFAALSAADAGAGGLTLTSPDIAEGAVIDLKFAFDGFGGGGGNVSPAFAWSEPPAGTRSFALFCHDPDAPTGGAGFWHWLVVDIPGTARALAQGAGTPDGAGLPTGAKQIRSDYGISAWGGPCPPVGDPPHRYVFTLYALGVEKVEAPEGATASLVGFLVNQNVLAKANLTGLYGR
ncbi:MULTISPECIES: YbhB/YbcL family Raf kinase inhibitor-like protein [Methylosinus]|uniref:YbhB/YbcL family Raf kinase inhibitor-like protein n=1 Tax=Methylosinus trichosporium (strain ATCC 35070 / NCIMB 11131 / UNIQEM 75 / OB3b) TaxID=595536 RepID=A0A2D2D2Y2_METT3|nr:MULTISPECIES: YbhB/YbcL family Raf kinase inhibitor-like protein [Methylosinus]ATQ69334.1 YbhB/YbcL family Raf kinase inhibitor-like protein [Methylosinus trichosporium OB3b]OBS52519.1 kinase inhibitor [Methylosinus sp. 3S-1]